MDMACTCKRTPCQEALRARVRGQEAAVRLVAAAVARARVQLQATPTATLRGIIGIFIRTTMFGGLRT